MWDYTEQVRDHYLHPRNVGEIKQPDGFGEIGNITCGDALRLTFKLDKDGRVDDIKFKTFGCGSAIASASVLTEMCKGKTIEEIKKISNKDIVESLGGLPHEKMHCSVMGQEALEAAITFYESAGKNSIPPVKQGKIICTCFNVTEKEIITAIKENNLTSLSDVTDFTKAGGACGKCHERINVIINRETGKQQPTNTSVSPFQQMTLVQKVDLLRKVIKNDIRPILEQDGGGCELIDLVGDTVSIKLNGHCAGCAFSNMTLISVVEKKLKEKVSPNLSVKLV